MGDEMVSKGVGLGACRRAVATPPPAKSGTRPKHDKEPEMFAPR